LTNGSQEGGSAKFEPKNDLDFTDDFTEKTMKKNPEMIQSPGS